MAPLGEGGEVGWMASSNTSDLVELRSEVERIRIELQRQHDVQAETLRELAAEQKQLKQCVVALQLESAPKEVPAAAPKSEGQQSWASQDNSNEENLDEDTYSFSESVWTAAVFIGTPALGRSRSIWVMLLLALTMVMQLLFCMVVLSNFTEPAYSDEVIQGLQSWRRSVGHNLRYMDDLSETSLVSRVCGSGLSHSSLELSTDQASHVELVRGYLPSTRRGEELSWTDHVTSGPVLCIFILFCYYATLIQEFQDIVRSVWALAGLPRGEAMTHMHMHHISMRRLLFLVVTACFRGLIGGMLCYSGTLFIIQTVDMRDLLLNAVALAFVLEVDELVYGAMAPVRVRNIISMMDPLPLRAGTKCSRRWTEWMYVGTMVVLVISLVLASTVFLQPLVEDLRAAEEALCGGHQNFVYSMDGTGTLSWAESSSTDSEAGDESNHLTRAVEQVISSDIFDLSYKVSSLPMLRTRLAQSVADAADEGRCLGDSLDKPQQRLFQDLLKNSSITVCEDISQLCDEDSLAGMRARQACPVECGCSRLTGRPLLNRDPMRGCGHTCHNTPSWSQDASLRDCRDITLEDVSRHYGTFLEALNQSQANAQGLAWRGLDIRAVDLFARAGCGAVVVAMVNFTQNLCLNRNLRPILLTLCPETCGCKDSPTQGCPTNCYEGQDAWASFMNSDRYQMLVTGRPQVVNQAVNTATSWLTRRRRSSPAQSSSSSAAPMLDSNATTTMATTTTPTTESVELGKNASNASNSSDSSNSTSTTTSTTTRAPTRRRRPWWR